MTRPAPEPPARVEVLARQRAEARAARDFAAADRLRAQIAAAGWTVTDGSDGYRLDPEPTYTVHTELAALVRAPSGLASERRATIAIVAEGWPDDLVTCVQALTVQLPADVGVTVLEIGNVDGTGDRLHALAEQHVGSIEALHLDGAAPFGSARAALLAREVAPVHVWLESSTIVDGDALTPMLAAFDDDAVVGVGWRGVATDDDWRGVHDVPGGPGGPGGPGREVEALLGYLFAMRTSVAKTVAADSGSLFGKARFYRNADLELSFALRDVAGPGSRLVAIDDLPVHQTRHRGFHDTDPAVRERESQRNYRRFLDRYRGREDLRRRDEEPRI